MSYLVTAAPEPDKVSGEKWFRWTEADGRGHRGQGGPRGLLEKSQAVAGPHVPHLPLYLGKAHSRAQKSCLGSGCSGHPAQGS